MSEYGDFDEEVALPLLEEAERNSPVKKGRCAWNGSGRQIHIPRWARLVSPVEPVEKDYVSTSGIGNSAEEKVARDRRIRKQGRDVTPDWVSVPDEKRCMFSKFSDFGSGPLTLIDWMVRSPPPSPPSTPLSRGVSELCGNPNCSGQHALSACPFRDPQLDGVEGSKLSSEGEEGGRSAASSHTLGRTQETQPGPRPRRLTYYAIQVLRGYSFSDWRVAQDELESSEEAEDDSLWQDIDAEATRLMRRMTEEEAKEWLLPENDSGDYEGGQ